MTLELHTHGGAGSFVEELLAEILDREWEVQSERTAPLGITPPVREGIELVVAGTPHGIFAVAPELRHAAVSPHELLDRVRPLLPADLTPWTRRALRRVGTLRAPQPLLAAPPGHARAALRSGAPPLPAASREMLSLDAPPRERPLPAEPAAEPAPTEPRTSRWPRAIAAGGACGALAGVLIVLLDAALAVPAVVLGALVGALAAAVGAGVAARAQRGGADG